MKKVLSLLMVIAMVSTLFVACGSKTEPASSAPATSAPATSTPAESAPAASAPAAGGYKVASHNAVIEGNAYRAVYEDQMTAAVEDAVAAGLISEYNSFVANNDPAIESQQIEQTINEGYDIIIVNPIAASGLDPIIDKATEAGITYVNADCVYDSDKILNVVVDQAEWARIQAEFAVKTLGKGGKIVQFNGIDGNSASEIRNEVWQKVLTEGGLEIVKTVAHNWSDVESKQLMSEIIASGLEFDGIINQEAANGILDAIEEAKIEYPGCITSSEEVAWIRRVAKVNESKLVMPFIVVENPPGIGATALAIALNLRQGNEIDPAKLTGDNAIYYAPQWVMTYDNMAEKLESVSQLPDSTSVSSYLSVADAKAAYFK
ncbi:substrate-binding domain-containing protein [Oscillospiraceae bacterium PP1C4]